MIDKSFGEAAMPDCMTANSNWPLEHCRSSLRRPIEWARPSERPISKYKPSHASPVQLCVNPTPELILAAGSSNRRKMLSLSRVMPVALTAVVIDIISAHSAGTLTTSLFKFGSTTTNSRMTLSRRELPSSS